MMLALTFLRAPFMHDHEHEENNSHPGGIFQAHFAHIEKPSTTPQFRDFDPDDDARDQNWFSAVNANVDLVFAVPVDVKTFEFALVSDPEPYAQLPIESGHDPPVRDQTAPRAPPL
jgi:hypothetical protein